MQPGYTRSQRQPDPNSFGFENAIRGLKVPLDQDALVEARPVFIVDPSNTNTSSPLRSQSILGSGSLVSGGLGTVGLSMSGIVHFTQGITASAPSSNDPEWPQGSFGMRGVSAANTQIATQLDIRELKKTLSIVVVYSGAATGTLKIESSTDAINWIIIDLFAAAASFAKLYTENTVGTTGAGFTAVSPLSFRYLRITVAAGGGTDTSTLTVGVK